MQKCIRYSVALTLFAGIMLCGCSAHPTEQSRVRTGQYEQVLQVTVQKKITLEHLLYLPEQYNESGDSWPLLIYLHGAGERGSDLNNVKVYGPPKRVEEGDDFPFIIVSPQCPEEQWWPLMIEPLNLLLDEVLAHYRVDDRRVYLTGLSMGGFGCWNWGCAHPERFAAIAPICGGGEARLACRLKDVPVWAFHGAKDNVVELKRSQDMVQALQACNGDVRFTVYPEAGHDSWTETYNNPELYRWFLSQKRQLSQ